MNIFGINGGELIVLVVLALFLLGPEKIPEYTRKLGDWIRQLRRMAEGAKEQFKDETGTDFDEVDWQRYDPRQYDPRRIIRDALSEPLDDLDHATGERKSTGLSRHELRQDLKELDPRHTFRSAGTRSPAATTAATTAGAAEQTPEPKAPAKPEPVADERAELGTRPAPFDADAT